MAHMTNEDWEQINKRIRDDPEYARDLIRRIMPKPTREIEGEEREKIMTLISLVEPFESSNNQRTMTDKYKIGNKIYSVTYGLYDWAVLEEELDETT